VCILKKKIVITSICIVCIAALFTVHKVLSFEADKAAKIIDKGKLLSDVYTDKARYNPKDSVNITIELDNKLNSNYSGKLNVYYKNLNKLIGTKEMKVEIKKGEKKSINIAWNPPANDFKGYMVEVYAFKGINVIDSRNTAVDVSSNWDRFPRYGYVAEYPKREKGETEKIIDNLNKYHINGLQFYDWQNKHHKPIPDTKDNTYSAWKDIANRDVYYDTVKNYIDAAHGKNMKAANYNLIYGAYTDYKQDGVKPEWGIYKDSEHNEQDMHQLPSGWASSIDVFNPANRDWQNYIFNEEKKANKLLNFDIFHMDTLGGRGLVYDYEGKEVDLPSTYTEFANNAKKTLGTGIVFNTVNRYGLEYIAKSDVDFLYSELWPSENKDYNSLKETVDIGYELTGGKKNTVIAAYMNYGSADSKGEFNENSVRLCDAAIFAAGGDHIELGDTGMLCKEYFPNKNLTMTDSLKASMRSYYDFITAYENLLRDNVSEKNNKIQLQDIKTSNDGKADTVWTYAKGKEGYDVIHMINLLGYKWTGWRDDGANYDPPELKKNIKLKYYIKDDEIKGVYLASPDLMGGKSEKLKYNVKEENGERYLEIYIPELQYWDMVYIEKE
jgi:dextranase